jgi:PIN domain nuclease of toxin-antitoxin system
VLVSAISVWEAVIKMGTGKLDAMSDLEEATVDSNLEFLPFLPRHATAVATLPMHHRDPFDRALIAQASSEGLRFVTVDGEIGRYSSLADIRVI